MQKEHEQEKNQESTRRRRAKRITTDFMRVEDAGTMPALTPFERETRKIIAAQSKTPRDEIAEKEEEIRKRTAFRFGRRKIRELIKAGALTRRQRLVYELSYVSGLKDDEVSDLLEVSPVTVRRLRLNIKEAFSRALRQQRRRQSAIDRAVYFKMTKHQKQIFKLHFKESLEPKQIAVQMGLSERNVYYILKRIEKKLFSE